MRALLPFLLVLLAACGTVEPVSREKVRALLSSSDGMKRFIDAMAQENLVNNKVVGMVIGVTTPKGTQFYAYGYKDKELQHRMPTDALFQIGSISKVFTASLMTVLEDEGHLNVKDPLKKFLGPDFKPRTKWVTDITLEELASHSSGLPPEYQNIKMLKSAIRFLWTGENIWKDLTDEELWAFVSEYNFGYKENRRYKYSNIGYVSLGGLLPRIVPGQSFEQMLFNRIITPLGMKDTVFDLDEEQKARLATGYSGNAPPFMKRGRKLEPWSFQQGLNAAGGLYSSAADLMTFLKVNMQDNESFLGKSFKKNHRKVIKFEDIHLGLGWFIETLPKSKLQKVYANGIISGYTSYLGFHAASNTGVVVLQNTMNMNYEFGERLLDELLLGCEEL